MTGYAHLDDDDVRAFWRDGYVIRRGYFSAAEIARVDEAIRTDPSISANVLRIEDGGGGSTELALWNHPAADVFGAMACGERLAGGMEKLLGGEVYHYHSKLTMKRPYEGGAWAWHQDYGYWYKNGCLYPDMASVAIAIDPATRANGCMQILKGSHKMGRIEHIMVGGQTGADMERVDEALKVQELVHCEMLPGDAMFFHANTLHCSARNTSDRSRNLLLCCYNKASNDPYLEHHHPGYTKLVRVPDSAVMSAPLTAGSGDRSFMGEGDDRTSVATRA